MKKIFLTLALLGLLFSFSGTALAANPVKVIVFTRTGCQYCAKTIAHLENLRQNAYPNIIIVDYDLLDSANIALYEKYSGAYGHAADSVPLLFVGEQMIVGYRPNDINWAIEQCSNIACVDPQEKVAQEPQDNTQKISAADPEELQRLETIGWVTAALILAGLGYVVYKKFS